MRNVVLVLVMMIATASRLLGQPSIGFEKDRLVGKGLTPGGEVVWFGLAWEQSGWAKLHRAYAKTVVAGSDGTAELTLEKDVPAISVWAAADVQSGRVGLATPEGFPLRRMTSPKPSVDARNPRSVPLSADRRGMLWAALVRPRVGAWYLRAGDGGSTDDDGAADGLITLRPGAMIPIGAAGNPPDRVTAGDALIAIDGETLEVYSDTVGQR